MRTVYKVVAWLIALEVVIQAALMVWAVAGLGIWVDQDGGVLDKAAMESEDTLFPELAGFVFHGMNGTMIIPALAVIFLIVSFFAKVPGGVKWAAFVLLAVAAQVFLGIYGHEIAISGMLHGINAMMLFALAAVAGVRAHRAGQVERPAGTATERELV